MSAAKKPMLSFTAAIFRGLQEDLRTTIKDLPIGLRIGLLEAHRKLSDYYFEFYILDPRISYDGLCTDFKGDDDLAPCLASATVLIAADGQPSKDFAARYRGR
ncbi:hypothetical protein C8F04DRAFT_1269718 [Mycena alexandri]|uniref:Uncharacterized protein n=1 Tax=Mycena alexandri TaxID=1745969 RepID=A0AAD6SCD5_9AGAR|nr:hypothetical protein C8F04DRAFT_1269718 [Mycena alexandri]